jgi:2-polyprenyl-3-methyl-5-hydroxy-6-metoxy-1,4-benzoquinol methylase
VSSAETVTTSGYAIEGGEEGKRRLNLLAEIMQTTTRRLLSAAGLRAGDRCLDVGCGGGHVTLDMARIVGPGGTAVGIDFDREILELAHHDAREAGLGNAEFAVADAASFDGGPFDLAYARFLLSHVSEPEQVLSHIATLVRPGGRVVLEDIDVTGCFCHPRDPAYDRCLDLYTQAVASGGGDANLGRRLPVLALDSGLRDAQWNVFQPVHASGPHKQIMALTMEKISAAVLRHGLAAGDEIDEILAGMRMFAADPMTFVSMPRIVQVWGTV